MSNWSNPQKDLFDDTNSPRRRWLEDTRRRAANIARSTRNLSEEDEDDNSEEYTSEDNESLLNRAFYESFSTEEEEEEEDNSKEITPEDVENLLNTAFSQSLSDPEDDDGYEEMNSEDSENSDLLNRAFYQSFSEYEDSDVIEYRTHRMTLSELANRVFERIVRMWSAGKSGIRSFARPSSPTVADRTYAIPSFTKASRRTSDISQPAANRASGISPSRASGIAPPRTSGISPPRTSGISPPRASGTAPPRTSGISPPRTSGISPPRASGISPPRASGISPPRASVISPSAKEANRTFAMSPSPKAANRTFEISPPPKAANITFEMSPPPKATNRTFELSPPPKAANRTFEISPPPKAANKTFELSPPPEAANRTFEISPPPKAASRTFEMSPPPKAANRTFEMSPPDKAANRTFEMSPNTKGSIPTFKIIPQPQEELSQPLWKMLIGEMCYQLNHRILSHVFTDQVSTCRCTLSKIPEKIIQVTTNPINGESHAVLRDELLEHYTEIMKKLRRLHYDINVHPKFTEDIIATYGRLSHRPDPGTLEYSNFNNYDYLYNIIVSHAPNNIRMTCLVLLTCLYYLARLDGQPMFLW